MKTGETRSLSLAPKCLLEWAPCMFLHLCHRTQHALVLVQPADGLLLCSGMPGSQHHHSSPSGASGPVQEEGDLGGGSPRASFDKLGSPRLGRLSPTMMGGPPLPHSHAHPGLMGSPPGSPSRGRSPSPTRSSLSSSGAGGSPPCNNLLLNMYKLARAFNGTTPLDELPARTWHAQVQRPASACAGL